MLFGTILFLIAFPAIFLTIMEWRFREPPQPPGGRPLDLLDDWSKARKGDVK